MCSNKEIFEDDGFCTGCNLSVYEITQICENQEELKNFLLIHGLIKDAVICPNCNTSVPLNWESQTYRCNGNILVDNRKRKCNFHRSIFKDTFFEFTTISIEKILLIVCYFVLIQPPRQTFIEHETECSHSTVSKWLGYCRDVCVDFLKIRGEKIGGVGTVVEIAKTTIGNDKHCVIGGVQQCDKTKCFVAHVPEFDENTIMKILQDKLLPGTTIITDISTIYSLGSEEFTFLKVNCNGERQFVDAKNGAHLQNITRVWREVKNNIPQSGFRSNQIETYIAEFLFKRRFPAMPTRIHNFLVLISESFAL